MQARLPRSSKNRKPAVVTVGLSNLDYVFQVEQFPPRASRTPAHAYLQQGGGPAATAAVAAARLGADVELWALHGEDKRAETLEAELNGYGVRTHRILRVKGADTWVSAVLVTPQGERFIFPYRDSRLLTAKGWDCESLPDVGCVLTDARHPAQSEPILREARRRGIPTIGDFSNSANWELASHIDHLIVSEECAQEVARTSAPADALARLKQWEGQIVGITLGDRGYIYLEGDDVKHVAAFSVDVVDTTGAGDVFHGAYAFGIAAGWHIQHCALFSSVAAALSCTKMGGRSGAPTLDEVLKLLPVELQDSGFDL